jgi:hypothetical protein
VPWLGGRGSSGHAACRLGCGSRVHRHFMSLSLHVPFVPAWPGSPRANLCAVKPMSGGFPRRLGTRLNSPPAGIGLGRRLPNLDSVLNLPTPPATRRRRCIRHLGPSPQGIIPTELYAIHAKVDRRNRDELAKLPGLSFDYRAHDFAEAKHWRRDTDGARAPWVHLVGKCVGHSDAAGQ